MNLIHRARKGFTAAKAAAVGTVALGMSQAHAGGGFTVPAELTTAAANVVIVGAAVFAIAVGIKLWKWYQRSL